MIVTIVLISPLIGAALGKLLLKLCRLLECDYSNSELEKMRRGYE